MIRLLSACRRVALALCLCALASPGWAAVAQTSHSAACYTGAAGQTFLICPTMVTVSGSNTALWCAIVASADIGAHNPDWDHLGTPQPMTDIGTGVNNGGKFLYQFGLVAPHAGNLEFSSGWTNNAEANAICIAFSGANQTSVAAAFINAVTNTGNTGASGTTPCTTGAITSAVNDMVAGLCAGGESFTGITATQAILDNGPTNYSYAADYVVGAASVTVTTTSTGNNQAWAALGVDITVPAAAGNTCPLTLLTTGVGC